MSLEGRRRTDLNIDVTSEEREIANKTTTSKRTATGKDLINECYYIKREKDPSSTRKIYNENKS